MVLATMPAGGVMASSDHGPPRPPPVPTEPDAQAAGWTRLDDADQVASELLEADAQRARQYLVRSARLAQEYLTDTAPDADEASADKLATAEQTAAELLVTAQQAAAGLLATAKKVAADRGRKPSGSRFLRLPAGRVDRHADHADQRDAGRRGG